MLMTKWEFVLYPRIPYLKTLANRKTPLSELTDPCYTEFPGVKGNINSLCVRLVSSPRKISIWPI